MQVRDEEKRRTILRVAREQFTRKPFHEVRLDDVAAAAHVGKGTLYVYFESKDALYLELVTITLDQLLDELAQLADADAEPGWATVEAVVQHVTRWTVRHPAVFDIMRSGVHPAGREAIRKRRTRMGDLIARVLRRAAEAGTIDDPAPEITAQFIPAMARSAVVHGDRKQSVAADVLAERILHVLSRGIRRRTPR